MNTTDHIQKIRLDDIQPSEVNKDIYNPTSPDGIESLANDIKRNGLLEPIVVTDDNIILSGHTRYKALKHLGRTFVKVRYAGINSDHRDFLKLLTSFNHQRTKTTNEKMKEMKLDIDPETYIRNVRQKRQEEPQHLKKVEGELKTKRTLSDNYQHLADTIKNIVNGSYRMTLRGVHYKLLNDPPIESKYTGNKYSNSKKSYQLLSKVATAMRVNGDISYSSIVDKKRKLQSYYKYGNMESFVGTEQTNFLEGYERDLLQSQERYIAIVCEKETLSYVIGQANSDYNLPVLYTQGNSSITVREKLINDSADKPMTLLFLTDLDPSGIKIQDSFVGSLKEDFYVDDLRAYRIALKQEHIKTYDLFSDQTAKISDTSYKKFHQQTGLKNAYELDAMNPPEMIKLIDEGIRSTLDMDRFNEQVRIYRQEVEDIQKRRQKALNSMVI